MAWGDLAKVSKLLSSLCSMDNGGGWQQKCARQGGKGGNGKGKAAGKGKFGGPGEEFQCCWSDCKAAQDNTPTKGGRETCHCCGRRKPNAKAPPLERMVAWAFQEALKAKSATKDGSKGKAARKGGKGSKGSKEGTTTDKDTKEGDLKRLREERLASLKEAKDGSPEQPTGGAAAASDSAARTPVPGGTAPKAEQEHDAALS